MAQAFRRSFPGHSMPRRRELLSTFGLFSNLIHEFRTPAARTGKKTRSLAPFLVSGMDGSEYFDRRRGVIGATVLFTRIGVYSSFRLLHLLLLATAVSELGALSHADDAAPFRWR